MRLDQQYLLRMFSFFLNRPVNHNTRHSDVLLFQSRQQEGEKITHPTRIQKTTGDGSGCGDTGRDEHTTKQGGRFDKTGQRVVAGFGEEGQRMGRINDGAADAHGHTHTLTHNQPHHPSRRTEASGRSFQLLETQGSDTELFQLPTNVGR